MTAPITVNMQYVPSTAEDPNWLPSSPTLLCTPPGAGVFPDVGNSALANSACTMESPPANLMLTNGPTQAYVLGNAASTLAAQGHVSVALLVAGILPHAVPELIALFLPLAAWIIASRRDQWHELLAATFVTVGIAVPLLIIAAFTEVYVSPHVILWLRG